MFSTKVVLLAALCSFSAVYSAVIPTIETNTRIVGGADALPNQIPYIASLRYIPRDGKHFCGSSIIKDRWVLTAAHCTKQKQAEEMFVVVGSILLSSGGVKHNVSQIIVHPEYSADLSKADISLVQVTSAFEFNAAVQPIGVSTEYVPSAAAVVSGWGLTNSSAEQVSDNLQTLSTKIISNPDCRKVLPDRYDKYIHESTVCALAKVNQGACKGDSGGPLVVGNDVVGVVSWGIPCAKGYPDAYTRASSYSKWILEKVDA